MFEESWLVNYNTDNFFYLKGVVDKLFSDLSLQINYNAENDSNYSHKLSINKGKETIGFMCELNKKILNKYSLDTKIYYAEIDISKIDISKINTKYKEVSKFPSSRRDVSMILDSKINFDEIKRLSFSVDKNILKEVNLFDVYQDKSMGNDKKSYAISFMFNDFKKTLTDKHIDQVMKKIIDGFIKELNAQIRDK